MSLINKLLKDLEKRQAYLYQDQDNVLDGLSSAYDLHQDRKNNRPIIICLMFFSAVIIFTYWFMQKDISFLNYESLSSKELVSITDDESSTNKYEGEKIEHIKTHKTNIKNTAFLQLDMNIDSNLKANELFQNELNTLQRVELYRTENGLEVKMENSLEINYFVYNLSAPSRTVIEIENTHLGFALEALQPIDPVSAIRYSINSNDRLKLVFESNTPLTINKSVTREAENKHLLVVSMLQNDHEVAVKNQNINEMLDLVEKDDITPENDTVFKGELIKTPSSQKHTLLADKLFKEAYSLYKQRNIAESLRLLNQALDQDAAHVNARTTLATILSEQGHDELAYSVLNEGLLQYPEVTQWRMVYARMLTEQEQFVNAEQILAAYKPRVSDNTDYYALYAAILQKLNDHNQSARLYRDLLHINPSNSIWWMGLGISLEFLKRYEDALYAYQKALSYPVLVDESKTYVTNRVSALTNLISNESS